MRKFAKMLSLTQLNYLILSNWVFIVLAFINLREFPHFCDFLISLVSNGSFLYFHKSVIPLFK